MKKIAPLLLSLLASVGVQAKDGPFGIQFGSNPTEYASCKIMDEAGYYKCDTAPKAHKVFDMYILLAAEGYGICWIKGVGSTVQTDSFGIGLRSKVDEIADQISVKYGTPKKLDTLLSGSIWSESNHWMMALLKGERIYARNWKDTEQLSAYPDLGQIFVGARATSTDKGYIVAEFYGKNHEACKAAVQRQGADKF